MHQGKLITHSYEGMCKSKPFNEASSIRSSKHQVTNKNQHFLCSRETHIFDVSGAFMQV